MRDFQSGISFRAQPQQVDFKQAKMGLAEFAIRELIDEDTEAIVIHIGFKKEKDAFGDILLTMRGEEKYHKKEEND